MSLSEACLVIFGLTVALGVCVGCVYLLVKILNSGSPLNGVGAIHYGGKPPQ